MTTDPFTDAATSAYEDYVRTPKMNVGTFRDRIAEAYMDAAEWARTYLAEQEPTDAEIEAAARALWARRWSTSWDEYSAGRGPASPDGTDLRAVQMRRARAALSAARAARRGEEKR